MKSFATALLMFPTVMVALVIINPLVGAFSGWVVGLFFGGVIQDTLTAFGFGHVATWKLGATLAFIGGFFKQVNTGGN